MCREGDAAKLDKSIFPGLQGGPLEHVIAGKAVCFELARRADFRERQHRTVSNARAMAEELLEGGLSLVSGGTDNHLILVDLSATPLTGKEGEDRLGRAGITVNKNGVPFDERPPTITSGLRIGTAALTTRGLRDEEMREIARIIAEALDPATSERGLDVLRARAREIGERHPLYPRFTEGTPVRG
jgi:glycine hydroxymethyltransferase